MRKRVLSVILICGILTGCGAKNAAPSNVAAETAVQASATDDAADVVAQPESSEDTTENTQYTLVPNIVDDNYRNYYEIFVASFFDSDGDGCGDLKGVEDKLDYITDLGCNGIWLMPVMSAPSYHKYDTDDYYLIDPSYGTNDDFKSLADACHDKGVKLIIDMVINHSSNEHPWFTEACEYLRSLPTDAEPDLNACPYVDYYHFSREKINASYCEVTGSDWYYEAVFYYTQPDLNLTNPALVEELYNVADFWMDLGCDGFRMDAVMHFEENDTTYNAEFLNNYFEHCRQKNPEAYMVSEAWTSAPEIASYYKSMTPSFFNFDAADAEGKLIRAGRGNLNAEKFVTACAGYEETFGASNPDYIDAPFITNHDMGRVANALKSNLTDLKMTGGLLLSMKGSPFIYYGEEIGMKSKGSKDENKRLHMNWSSTDASGICDDPEGADDGIEQSLPPADEQVKDEASLYSYYKNALAIRNKYPEIARGTTKISDELTDGDIAVITRTLNDEKIIIIYNTGEDAGNIDLSAAAPEKCKIVGELYASESGASLHNTELTIPGRSILYIK